MSCIGTRVYLWRVVLHCLQRNLRLCGATGHWHASCSSNRSMGHFTIPTNLAAAIYHNCALASPALLNQSLQHSLQLKLGCKAVGYHADLWHYQTCGSAQNVTHLTLWKLHQAMSETSMLRLPGSFLGNAPQKGCLACKPMIKCCMCIISEGSPEKKRFQELPCWSGKKFYSCRLSIHLPEIINGTAAHANKLTF